MQPIPTWEEVGKRLERIFPEGIENRLYVVRESAAKTVFVMLYVGAVEGNDLWVRPDQVTRMTDAQAATTDVASRLAWTVFSTSKAPVIENRWYAVNSREGIRDESISRFEELGAIVSRPLPTTSGLGRYALKESFAALFHPDLAGEALERAVAAWRADNLSPSALARVRLVQQAIVETGQGVMVHFPNGETRRLAPGPSSVITKAVVEQFAPRFLEKPGILWISESARKEDRRDAELARLLGLSIEVDRNLPDLILVDLGPRDPLFVFVEVVATDGPVNEMRREAFLRVVTEAGYGSSQATFVTAYLDRGADAFRKTFSVLARQTFAWCMSEPDDLILLAVPKTERRRLSELTAILG